MLQIRLLMILLVTACVLAPAWASEPRPETPSVIKAKVRGKEVIVDLGKPVRTDADRSELAYYFWNEALRVIMIDEILKRKVTIHKTDLDQTASDIALEMMRAFGETPEEREQAYQTRRKGVEILDVYLKIWEKNPEEADARVKAEMVPKGFPFENWQAFTSTWHRPEIKEEYQLSRNVSDESIKAYANLKARERMAYANLGISLVGDRQPPAQSMQLFSRLLAHARRGQVTLEMRRIDIYESGQLLPTAQRPSEIREITTYAAELIDRERSTGSLIELLAGQPAGSAEGVTLSERDIQLLQVASLYFDVIKPGETWSKPWPGFGNGIVPIYQFRLQLHSPLPAAGTAEPLNDDMQRKYQSEWMLSQFARWLLVQLRNQVQLSEQDKWVLGSPVVN